MNFKLHRHARTAGSLAAIAGMFLKNWQIILFGWTIVALAYMFALSAVEHYIESQTQKERENAIR